MKADSGEFTRRVHPIDPKQARAQATGIGMTRTASLVTGGNRAQRVVDSCPPECFARTPENEGYPARTPETPPLMSPNRPGTW